MDYRGLFEPDETRPGLFPGLRAWMLDSESWYHRASAFWDLRRYMRGLNNYLDYFGGS